MLAAFGIAYSHSAGNRQCILDGALTKRMQVGQAASAGVTDPVADRIHRRVQYLQWPFRVFRTVSAHSTPILLRDLGTAFRGEALSYKPYPCGRPLHVAIDAALLVPSFRSSAPTRHHGRDDEADPAVHGDQFERGPAKRRPTQVVEAQFAQRFSWPPLSSRGKIGIAEVDGLGNSAALTLSNPV